MTGRLVNASVSAPGFLGLNSQESEVTLESGYATQAMNCIIDRYGRIGSRRGWQAITTNNGTLADTDNIEALFEFTDVDGISTILSAGGLHIYSGTDTLSEVPLKLANETTNSSTVFTGNQWQFQQLAEGAGFGNTMYGFAAQASHPLLVYRRTGHSGSFILQEIGVYGTKPTGVSSFDPKCIHAAFGRVWVANISAASSTIYYSKLLDGTQFTGVGSGLIDVSSVVGNTDEIVALSSHNGFLVVFCKKNIIIYSGADDPTSPTSLQVSDVITGVGCIARDSVQQTGTDLVFLSNGGVRSLTRTIQEKSMPMRDLSINVRDELVEDLGNETISDIKSVFFERDAFYLLSLPSTKVIYCFDMRSVLPNGGARITKWNTSAYYSFCVTSDRNLYLGVTGKIAKYTGYRDNGASYRMIYFTSNSDFGQPSVLKLLRKAKLIIIGNETQDFVLKYSFDYKVHNTPRYYFNQSSQIPSEYNTAEYGVGEYTGGLVVVEASVHLGGSGRVVKFGLETEIDGAPVSIQKADLFVKLGKLL